MIQEWCTRCTRWKEKKEFNWRYQGIMPQSICLDCSRLQIRDHYESHQEQEKKRSYEITKLQIDNVQRVAPHNTVVTSTTLQQSPFRQPSACLDVWAASRPELALEIQVAPYPYENKKTVFSGTPLPRLQECEKAGFSNSEHFFHI
jgi:hypothetical protein